MRLARHKRLIEGLEKKPYIRQFLLTIDDKLTNAYRTLFVTWLYWSSTLWKNHKFTDNNTDNNTSRFWVISKKCGFLMGRHLGSGVNINMIRKHAASLQVSGFLSMWLNNTCNMLYYVASRYCWFDKCVKYVRLRSVQLAEHL